MENDKTKFQILAKKIMDINDPELMSAFTDYLDEENARQIVINNQLADLITQVRTKL